ncbi:cell envelope integrity protein CreD [Parvularcula marina]|uniref:Cell envelope integrity protein CreD n=1 Tax=Parvularcula marina TaxID=2292771 RepID=A0A371RJ87_9PROT|nr:cell envelope integrity protein CreD [Parvularcula marina]RFB05504.1 cell envelope integrity protein CreD [Parvularcula marina]
MMSDTTLEEAARSLLPKQTRAVGLKFILVGLLALMMWIPALFIYALVYERSGRASLVTEEIYQREGGEQKLAGPFLIIPAVEQVEGYRFDKDSKSPVMPVRRTYILLPETVTADIDLATEQRHRSIFTATVYEAGVRVNGRFDPKSITVPQNTELLWSEARIAMGLSSHHSLTGVRGAPALSINGTPQTPAFQSGYEIIDGPGETSDRRVISGLSAPLSVGIRPQAFDYELQMTLSGGGSIGFAPLGDSTDVTMTGDWPHPGMTGSISPLSRTITEEGFEAGWRTSSLSRPLAHSFMADKEVGSQLMRQMLSVNLVNPDTPYGKINRSLKYALLFMGLIFLTVFLLEIIYKSRAHPSQYILIGLAQVLFYVMVLALSEHVPFDTAFLGMAVVTVLLSGFYAASIFRRRAGGIVSALAFAGVYCLIWLLMKSEDFALLIGASCAFTALAITMFVTRNIDWYGVGGRKPDAQTT